MSPLPLVSIIINNYNYGHFLDEAIDSALTQSYPNIEVIVVDDGSTDNSREIIANYVNRLFPIVKENGGQGSAFNAGFAASRGDIVIFLDSDDVLLPTAAEKAVPFFGDPDVVKVHWPLWLVNADGTRTGQIFPGPELPEGDFRKVVLQTGPTNQLSAPTSGNAWCKRYLAALFPLPEDVYRAWADTCLFEIAPFLGKIAAIREPQGNYRQHRKNLHTAFSLDRRLEQELRFYDQYTTFLVNHFLRMGIHVDLATWKRNSWWHLQQAAVSEIASLPEPKRPLILIDGAAWEPGLISGRERIAFLERDGQYWGPPADGETAIREFEVLRTNRAPSHIVFAWSCFWWFDAFPGFARYLETRYTRVLQSQSIIAFDIRGETDL
jgi:glycosyltransferase involved in cell wall biosynthesis